MQIRDNLTTQYADIYTPETMAALAVMAGFNDEQKRLMAERIERRAARIRERRPIGFLAPEALIPGLDQVRTAGVVTLPGAFIGVLLGGGSPAQAAAAQVLVLMGIMASQTITAVVAERLIMAAKLLPDDLRVSLQP